MATSGDFKLAVDRPRSMPRSEPPSHDAGLACPQLSAAATDDDVGRLATTMLDRLARPPLGQGTATFSSPDVDLTQSAFEGRPRHIATVGQPRLPRQGSLLKSCSRTLSRGCDRVVDHWAGRPGRLPIGGARAGAQALGTVTMGTTAGPGVPPQWGAAGRPRPGPVGLRGLAAWTA